MSKDSIYGQKLYLAEVPVTVVGERYERVFYVEGHHDLGEMDSDEFRGISKGICCDMNSGQICHLPVGHERSHESLALGGAVSWGGWQGCLCDVPNTQASRCPKHGNTLPVEVS